MIDGSRIYGQATLIEMGMEWRARHQRLQELTGLPARQCRTLLWAAGNDVESALQLWREIGVQ